MKLDFCFAISFKGVKNEFIFGLKPRRLPRFFYTNLLTSPMRDNFSTYATYRAIPESPLRTNAKALGNFVGAKINTFKKNVIHAVDNAVTVDVANSFVLKLISAEVGTF